MGYTQMKVTPAGNDTSGNNTAGGRGDVGEIAGTGHGRIKVTYVSHFSEFSQKVKQMGAL